MWVWPWNWPARSGITIVQRQDTLRDVGPLWHAKPEVQKGMRDADYEISAQERLIESRGKDLEAIKIKYDEDVRRYRAIAQRTVVR